MNKVTNFTVPKAVAELGPGDSLGIGLCALLTGADRYIGLDLVPFTDLSRNLVIFNELVELFQSREPIPNDNEFPRIRPKLSDYSFPSNILDDETMSRALTPERKNAMRDQLLNGTGEMMVYAAPWYAKDQIEKSSVDWIFSQAVLEHVDELDQAYQTFAAWIKPHGVMSHQIDFKCHNLSALWNGHWAAPDWLWRIVYGRRPYFLNRQPLSRHQALLEKSGFDTLLSDRAERYDGLAREQLQAGYRNLTDEDLITAGAFIVTQKQES